ncbi:MAG: c-type cytochrome [Elusimicrobia bacterium]|nr:c-type cytochrome [Elusimicrobiota bacterium]
MTKVTKVKKIKEKTLLLVTLVTLVALVTFPSCQQAKTPQQLGKAYFRGYGCNNCHRIGSEGGKIGPDLTFVGFRKSRQWLDQWLKNPHNWKNNTLMPNFNLPDHSRNALVEYLLTLKGEGFDQTGRPWNDPSLQGDLVKKGEVLFERAGCVACHAQKGRGGYPNNNVAGGQIPSLTLAADGFSKEELKQRIREGRKSDKADPKGPAPMIEMPQWGKVFGDDELDAAVEYVYSLRPPKAAGEEW